MQPAEYASWSEARSELMVVRGMPAHMRVLAIMTQRIHRPPIHSRSQEAKRPLKAQLTAEVAAAESEGEATAIRAAFEKREKALEHEIDHKPLEVHMSIEVDYNFLSK